MPPQPNLPGEPTVQAMGGGPGDVPRRPRWLPLLVALGTVVGFAAVAGNLGTDGSTSTTASTTTTIPDLAGNATPEDSATTTTTTLPDTLAVRLPGFDGIISLAATTGSGGAVLLWGSSERTPRAGDLTAPPDEASFDASGSWIAYRAYTDANPALFVGLRTGSQRVEGTAVTSAVWHPTVERALAWVTTIPTDRRTVLLIGQVDPPTGILEVGREVAALPTGSRVAAWGSWGFAVQSTTGSGIPSLTVLSPDGAPVVTAPVDLRAWTADGRLLVESHADGYRTAGEPLVAEGWAATPEVLVPGIPDGSVYLTDPTLRPGDAPWIVAADAQLAIHPGGERVAEVEVRDGRFTAVTSLGTGPRQAPRSTSVDLPSRLIGYSDDGRYLILQAALDAGGEVFVLDWNTGAFARLDVGGVLVLAAEMQPTLAPGTVTPSTTPAPDGPSQTSGDAVRDGVVAELAALPLGERADILVEVPADEGPFVAAFRGYTWALARPPQELQAAAGADGCRFGDLAGTYPVDVICVSDYGEILLLDAAGRIARAYPMPGAPPSWIAVDDAFVWAGRIGDGALPDSTVVRIDRASLAADVVVVPATFDGGTEWPSGWRVATPDQAAAYPGIVGFAPDVAGNPVDSWIGPVVVDRAALLAWFSAVSSTP